MRRFGKVYSAMRREIIEHDYNVDKGTVDELHGMEFVFIAIDSGKARRLIAEALEEFGVGFIDAGLGVREKNHSLIGMVRTTTSSTGHRSKGKLPFRGGGEEDDYTRNIQIAELNALNAILAVIKWKKLVGFYADSEREHQSLYTIVGNYRSTRIPHEPSDHNPARVRRVRARDVGGWHPLHLYPLQDCGSQVRLRVREPHDNPNQTNWMAVDLRRQYGFAPSLYRELEL